MVADQPAVLNDVCYFLMQFQFRAVLLHVVNELEKGKNGVCCSRTEQGLIDALDTGLPQRVIMFACYLAHCVNRAPANPARRDVDDAFNSSVIVTINQQPQVGQRVLNFKALIEAVSAINAIRHANPQQGIFKFPGLCVGSVQNGCIRAPVTTGKPVLQSIDNKACFILFVEGFINADGFAVCSVGPQVFAEATLIV